jgi:methionyl aminopeptidase
MIPIKTAKEIDKMRAACRTASEILERVSDLVKPGISTKEIDEAAADLMREAGVRSAFLGYRLGHRVFPGNICISLNDEIVHGIGSRQRRIQYGDIVKLDIGVIQEGWVGDTATTVPVGMIEERTEQLLRVTEAALERAIAIAVEGARLGDICAEIEDEAVRNKFSVVREFVGHGVGRKLHEEPQIPNYGKRGSGPKLKAGMTLAIEPMINLGTAAVRLLDDGWTVRTADGMPSAHFEHTVLITKDEPEILTWRARTQLK